MSGESTQFGPGNTDGRETLFKPGQSGNPGGRPQTKLWRSALLREVDRASRGHDTKKIDLLARKLVAQALAGDVNALREIGDRLDGKPTQEHELSGALQITKIERVIVDPKNPNG